MNHRQFFDQAAAEWDALEVEETQVRYERSWTRWVSRRGQKLGEDKSSTGRVGA
jgi:hypothetical protein